MHKVSMSESSSSPELPATGGEQQPKARQTNKDSKPTPAEKPKQTPAIGGTGRIRGSASSGPVSPAKTRQESATKAKGRTIEKPLPQKPATGGHASSEGFLRILTTPITTTTMMRLRTRRTRIAWRSRRPLAPHHLSQQRRRPRTAASFLVLLLIRIINK